MLRTMPLVIQSAEDQVYAVLRDEILHALPPGTPLPLTRIAEHLGVSTMPVRAALLRLEADGLVRVSPGRGAVVAPLEADELQEIQAIRSGLEGLAARLGARRIDDRGLQRMSDLLGVMRASAARGDLESFLPTETAFEDECYRAAGRPQLLAQVRSWRERADRYVRLALDGTPGFEIGYSERLLAAAVAHDGPAAETTIRAALAWTLTRLAPRLDTGAGDTTTEAAAR